MVGHGLEPARLQPHGSNIPGPRFPVYLLGAELTEAYPVVPIAEQHALSIGMFSYHDLMCFGLYADPDALPEVAELPTFLNSEILALAGPRNRRTRRAVEGRPAKNKASQRLRSVPV